MWTALLPNVQCTQVALSDIPTILDSYPFDITSPGGAHFGSGYGVHPQHCTNKGRVGILEWQIWSYVMLLTYSLYLGEIRGS